MNSILNKVIYGYHIVTALKPGDELKTRERDYIAAGTVNWLTQISFEPAMFAVAIGMKADLNETIDYSKHFTIHPIAVGQEDWIKKFSNKSVIENGKINGISFQKKDHALILPSSLGYITCKLERSFNNGDHTLHIGSVVDHHTSDEERSPICTKDSNFQPFSRYKKSDAEV